MELFSLTDNNFKKELSSNDEIINLLFFYSTWSGLCLDLIHQMSLIEFEKNNLNSIKIVNIEENPDLTKQFSIVFVPTYVFLKNKKECKRLIGIQSEKDLKETFDLLNKTAKIN